MAQDLTGMALGIARLSDMERHGAKHPDEVLAWAEDGYALWRLREAIEGRYGLSLEMVQFADDTPSHWRAHCRGGEFVGATIAEAADKCRAALPPNVDKLRNEGTI